MKTIYIPKGETVHYESLSTDHLIVSHTDKGGCLLWIKRLPIS